MLTLRADALTPLPPRRRAPPTLRTRASASGAPEEANEEQRREGARALLAPRVMLPYPLAPGGAFTVLTRRPPPPRPTPCCAFPSMVRTPTPSRAQRVRLRTPHTRACTSAADSAT
jgi:hypothetical protein